MPTKASCHRLGQQKDTLSLFDVLICPWISVMVPDVGEAESLGGYPLYVPVMFVIMFCSKLCFQVTEDSAHSGKSDFADFKNIVWHESVRKIFESIVQYSKTGYSMDFNNKTRRSLHPLVLIGSSDFEEQYVKPILCCTLD